MSAAKFCEVASTTTSAPSCVANADFSDVETVTAKEESLLFSLPPELRKDLKAAGK